MSGKSIQKNVRGETRHWKTLSTEGSVPFRSYEVVVSILNTVSNPSISCTAAGWQGK